jgi:hypothetical protein
MKIDKLANKRLEQAAKRRMFEQLFDDFYANRGRVYKINFFRGLFFGFGSVLGGTVIVGFLVWILSRLANWFPFISDLIRDFINTVQG